MDLYKSQGLVVLDRYQDFEAVTLGAEQAALVLPDEVANDIAHAHDSWSLPAQPTSSWQRKGLIVDFINRIYPPVYISGNELSAVEQACSEIVAIDGLKGAYYKVRGFKKAARNIIAGIQELDEQVTA